MAQEIIANLDAEKAFLGSVLLDNTALDRVIIKAEAFYDSKHKKVFEAMSRLYAGGKKIDEITVSDELGQELENIGGRFYVTGIIDYSYSAENSIEYANLINEKWQERDISETCRRIVADIDAGEGVSGTESTLLGLFEQFDTKGFESPQESIRQINLKVQSILDNPGEVTGVRTGLAELDGLTGGMGKSDLVIIGGRPSMGKTSLALSIARWNCGRSKKVAIASLESSKSQLIERLMFQLSGVDAHKYRSGYLKKGESEDILYAGTVIEGWDLWIDDSPSVTMLDIFSRTRRLKAQHGIDMLFIDYLQRMGSPRKGVSRNEEVEEYSRQAKSIAKELEIPVVLVSQLSRGTEHRPQKRPMMSDLRDSGGIEQEADQVWLLYRPEYYGEDFDEDQASTAGKAEIIVGKNRDGRTGSVQVKFSKETTDFQSFKPESPL